MFLLLIFILGEWQPLPSIEGESIERGGERYFVVSPQKLVVFGLNRERTLRISYREGRKDTIYLNTRIFSLKNKGKIELTLGKGIYTLKASGKVLIKIYRLRKVKYKEVGPENGTNRKIKVNGNSYTYYLLNPDASVKYKIKGKKGLKMLVRVFSDAVITIKENGKVINKENIKFRPSKKAIFDGKKISRAKVLWITSKKGINIYSVEINKGKGLVRLLAHIKKIIKRKKKIKMGIKIDDNPDFLSDSLYFSKKPSPSYSFPFYISIHHFTVEGRLSPDWDRTFIKGKIKFPLKGCSIVITFLPHYRIRKDWDPLSYGKIGGVVSWKNIKIRLAHYLYDGNYSEYSGWKWKGGWGNKNGSISLYLYNSHSNYTYAGFNLSIYPDISFYRLTIIPNLILSRVDFTTSDKTDSLHYSRYDNILFARITTIYSINSSMSIGGEIGLKRRWSHSSIFSIENYKNSLRYTAHIFLVFLAG